MFSSIIDIKLGDFKLGIRLFNSSYKTIYLSNKNNLCFFYKSNEYLSKLRLQHLKMHKSAVKLNDVSHNFNFQSEI